MSRNNLNHWLENEPVWMDIKEPQLIKDKIMNHIDRSIFKRFYFLKVFKYASISLFSLSIVLSAVLIVNGLKPMKIVFIYPHSNSIQNVEVVGNFNNQKQEKVKMELNEEKGVWQGEVKSRKKNVGDYVINVEETDNADTNNADPEASLEDDSVGI